MQVPFTPGRMDASQEQTDVESSAGLEPTADYERDISDEAVLRYRERYAP